MDAGRHEGNVALSSERSISLRHALIVLAALIVFFGWMISTCGTKLENRTLGNKNSELAAELIGPNSREELLASLAKAQNTMLNARGNSDSVDRWKVIELYEALWRVVYDHPDVAEGWQTAGMVISSPKPASAKAALLICGSSQQSAPTLFGLKSEGEAPTIEYDNCTIVLDDDAEFSNIKQYLRVYRKTKGDGEGRRPLLQLKNVHAIYRGGKIPAFDAIAFLDSTFDFEIHRAPPESGRFLTRALLQTSDIKNVGVELSGAYELDSKCP